MHALKTIVISLSVALILGLGLLVYGLTQNWHRMAGTAPPVPAAGWGSVALQQAPEARLRAVTAAGDTLALHVSEADGARDRVIVVNPANGAVLGTFWIGAAP